MNKPPPKGTAVAVYGRWGSTQSSVSDQIAICCLFAESRKWVVVDVYQDVGQSGRRTGRALQQMIEDAAGGRFKVVLVRDLSRIGRHPALVQNVLNMLGAVGVSVGVVPDPPVVCDDCASVEMQRCTDDE